MKRLVVSIVVLLLAVGLLLLAGLGWYSARPLPMAGKVVEFTLPPGTTMKSAARQIQAAGVPVQPMALEWMARLTGKDRGIKAGSYEFAEGLTPWSLLLKLTRGDVTQAELTIVEGWTFRQLRAAIDAHPDFIHDSTGLSERDILARIGAEESNPEGLFLPDTYLFSKRSSDLHLLQRAYRAMQGRLAQGWGARSEGLPLASPYEALILASIVEKETGRREDRPLVASVFINRLRAGMRLQTDPTVIYGLGPGFDGNLTRRNLQADGPYNTYLRVGLPPTPIALPGADALRVALQPPPTDYWYFVAKGDGSSEFSRTLDDHNRAVTRYQKRN